MAAFPQYRGGLASVQVVGMGQLLHRRGSKSFVETFTGSVLNPLLGVVKVEH